jgi:hypothetical protein
MSARLHLIVQQLELRFWYFFISLMDESPLVSFIIQELYPLFSRKAWLVFIKRSALSLGSGLLLGFVLGIVIQLFS